MLLKLGYSNKTNNPNDSPKRRMFGLFSCGRSDRTRTCSIVLPKHARYQLRHTSIFNFGSKHTKRSSHVLRATVPAQPKCLRHTSICIHFFVPIYYTTKSPRCLHLFVKSYEFSSFIFICLHGLFLQFTSVRAIFHKIPLTFSLIYVIL